MRDAPSGRLHSLVFRLGRRAALRGFDVRALLPDRREWTLILARLDDALRLLESYTPTRYAMLQRDITRLWVTGIPSRGAFIARRAMCVLDFEYVTAPGTRTEEIALTLVHEGTHARLRRLGFGYAEPLRARIERLCIGSELVVSRRLPGCDDLAAEAAERLQWEAATWSDARTRERHLHALRELGWPGRLGYHLARAVRILAR
jgi:hypothetical protein